MASFIEELLDRVVVESAWGPTVEIAPGEAPSETSLALQRLMKPKASFYLKGSATPSYVWAPHGEPGPTKWPWIEALAVGGAVGVAMFVLARVFGASNFLFSKE